MPKFAGIGPAVIIHPVPNATPYLSAPVFALHSLYFPATQEVNLNIWAAYLQQIRYTPNLDAAGILLSIASEQLRLPAVALRNLAGLIDAYLEPP